jgi:hypothetical protein
MLVGIGFALCTLVIASLTVWNIHLSAENDKYCNWYEGVAKENQSLWVKYGILQDERAAEHRDRDAKGRYTKKC